MREASGLFLILFGAGFVWVGVHGFEGTGLAGLMNTIFGAIGKVN
jgi:hypothetical protein